MFEFNWGVFWAILAAAGVCLVVSNIFYFVVGFFE
jgi:hypothetical protein